MASPLCAHFSDSNLIGHLWKLDGLWFSWLWEQCSFANPKTSIRKSAPSESWHWKCKERKSLDLYQNTSRPAWGLITWQAYLQSCKANIPLVYLPSSITNVFDDLETPVARSPVWLIFILHLFAKRKGSIFSFLRRSKHCAIPEVTHRGTNGNESWWSFAS